MEKPTTAYIPVLFTDEEIQLAYEVLALELGVTGDKRDIRILTEVCRKMVNGLRMRLMQENLPNHLDS